MEKEPIISRFLSAKAAKNRVPLNGTFELSPCCNLSCKMCYVRKSKKEVNDFGGEKSVGEWLELAKECRDAGMLFLLLTGGEPFLYKDFKKLYIELKKMGFMISINTNGTLIDEGIVEWLKKYPPNRMQITLYGASNETYKKLCGLDDGFDKTTKTIKMLKEAGIAVKMNACMTQYNIHDLEKLYEFAKELDIKVQATSYMFPPVRRDEKYVGVNDRFSPKDAAKYSVKIDKLRLTNEEFKLRAESLKNGLLKFKDDIDDCEVIDSSNIDKNVVKEKNEINVESVLVKKRDKLKCRAGKSSFWINWKGEMTPCGLMNWPVSYPFKDGLTNSWYKIIDETNKIRMPKKCSSCKNKSVCSVCAAAVISETGDLNVVPKYICTMTEEFIEETIRENK